MDEMLILLPISLMQNILQLIKTHLTKYHDKNMVIATKCLNVAENTVTMLYI